MPESKAQYPKGAYFILAGYLSERFVYYGLIGGAVFYMQRVLYFSAAQSSTIKSILEGLIYLAPILGAVIADTFFGKFRLVFTMCCCYTVGVVIYSLSAASPIMTSPMGTQATGIGGMLVFGLSAGIMKAVYSSLGPDQFILPEQRKQQQSFFYFFYWMINAGAFCGTLLTAQLRGSVQCFGSDCFLLPYGILGCVMIASTAVFYAGKRHYREAPPDPMLLRALKCICRAVKLKFTGPKDQVEHWVDRAAQPGKGCVKDPSLIADVKKTMGVLLLFTTFPLFWALFYQTSTGMIFQAKRLNDLVGTYRIPPELTSSINPIFILILIPIFDRIVYPIFDKLQVLTSTTSRMSLGMLFAVVSFIIYGCLGIQVEQYILGSGEASVGMYNARDCPVHVMPWANQDTKWMIEPHSKLIERLQISPNSSATLSFTVTEKCSKGQSKPPQKVSVMLEETKLTTLIIDTSFIRTLKPSLDYIKDKDAEAKVRITSLMERHSDTTEIFILKYLKMNVSIPVAYGISDFKKLAPQPYQIIHEKTNEVLGDVQVKQDGVYDIIWSPSSNISVYHLTAPSDVHVLWTIPQYLFMTIGEVLFSVSGMDFAYTEAPKSMKSIMQAANLFTITVGLWLFAILTSINDAAGTFAHKPSREAFMYAVLMLMNTMVFFVLVRRYYKYSKIDDESANNKESKLAQKDSNDGQVNLSFEEDSL